MKDKDHTDNDSLNIDQLGSTRPNLSNQSKGGSVTKSFSINRKKKVEECMLKGLSATQMVDLKLGGWETICNDVKEIHRQWLEKDPEWIERVRLARIEVKKKYDAQIQRLRTVIANKKVTIKDKLYAESLVTTVKKIIEKWNDEN